MQEINKTMIVLGRLSEMIVLGLGFHLSKDFWVWVPLQGPESRVPLTTRDSGLGSCVPPFGFQVPALTSEIGPMSRILGPNKSPESQALFLDIPSDIC